MQLDETQRAKNKVDAQPVGQLVVRSTPPAPPEAKPRLLFFYDPNDGAARRCEGYLAQVLQHRRNHQTFLIHHIDISQHAELAERFRVAETPSILVIAEGRIRARLTKPKGCGPIREKLEPWLR